MGFKYKFIILLCCALCVSTSAFSVTYDSKKAYKAWVTISKIEHREGIPSGLLHSISLVETGKGVSGNVLPWPYTLGINSPGYKNLTLNNFKEKFDYYKNLGFKQFSLEINGSNHKRIGVSQVLSIINGTQNITSIRLKPWNFSKRFSSKKEGAEFATKLIEYDYDNFDIGMMQINWHYHKNGFKAVEDAFDVYKNTNYAVSYLRKHRKNRTWWESVGRYHSGTEKHAKKYIRSVWNMYKRIHRLGV